MIKYYTSSAYRKHYSDLETLNLLNQSLEVQPYDLGNYVLKIQKLKTQKSSKSPSKSSKSPTKNAKSTSNTNQSHFLFDQLIADLEVFKNITLTPIKIFKSLLLIHCCFLLVKNCPSDDQINSINLFFKWIVEQTIKMIEKHSKKQNEKTGNSKLGSSKIGNSFTKKSQTTTFELLDQTKSARIRSSSMRSNSRPKSTSKYSNQDILSKELCLLSNIIKPYTLYLQKILSIYPQYQNFLHSIPSTLETSEQSTWTILNIFKLMSPIVLNFNHIGRYFYKQYSPIVYLLIEFFSKQVSRLYPKVYAQSKRKISLIQHQWFVLLQTHSEYQIFHDEQIQIEGVQNAMMLVDQVTQINDSLYHIYLGKYFYQVVQKLRLPEPKWFEIHSKQCEFLLHYNKMKFKNGRRKSIRESSKDKRSTSFSKQIQNSGKKPFSDNNIQNKCILSNSNLPKSQPITHKIVIEKKHLIPKVKNSLKLGRQKQNKQKQDTITFRVKQMNNPLSISKTLQDQSFRKEDFPENNQNFETIRAKVRNYQVIQS